jgi:L-fuculose-phosphate aldolase
MKRRLMPGHSKNKDVHCRELCTVGRWLYEREFIVAAEGNLSVRLSNGHILITPTCLNKGMLEPGDMVVIDLEGRHISGARQVSSEFGMHLFYYKVRPDVNAICHAHPPTATGFASSGRGLDRALLPEVVVGLGKIPLVQYATPGTPDLISVLEPYAPHYDALLLANHGALTCGPDLLTAFFRMETVEHTAKITLAAEAAGVPVLLSSCEVERLVAARSRYFVSLPPGGGGGLPESSDSREIREYPAVRIHRETDALWDVAVRKSRVGN